ncbi:MAG: KpsF/GutQ family sugar-phosphate isomerase [Candidatus Omnitrophica bacterium]|nr:KpsF/GutQ family sugar-phosphate isomerase [Candidatus Omnitrophota bacterium]
MTIERARSVLRNESRAIADMAKRLDKKFLKAIEIICQSKGRVIVTGMGKPGFIAQKISATLSSTGTPSLYLHPAEALHGDVGRVMKDDCVLCLSNSGETEEVVKLLPVIKRIGSKLISITGNVTSTLAKNSDCILDASIKKEACPLGLAPTTSTTAMLALGDALAVSLLDRKGFKRADFAFFHPGGSLGRKLLLKVDDIMRKGSSNPLVKEDAKLKDVLLKITRARAGSACVIGKGGRLTGIFTDGDLRRHIESGPGLLQRKVKDVMTKNPRTIRRGKLAAEAFQILRSKKIDEVPVVDEKNRPVGLVDVQDLLKAGLV